MKERHLRLVVPSCRKKEKNKSLIKPIKNFFNYIDSMFTSKQEKIYIIKDFLIKLYRDYEVSTGIVYPPYFYRAEYRIIQIVKENKVDYYYNLYKKHKNENF